MAVAQQNAFTFKYSNKSYNIVVTLYTETGNPKDDITRSLDMNFIDEVMYESELNDLVFYGHVIYTDKYAFIDQFKNFQYRYCRITFATNTQKTDGDRGMTNIDINNMFDQTFIVSNILQIDRQANAIKYKIDLISSNWFKCIANIPYSNLDEDPQPLMNIIKNYIVYSQQKTDDSFKKVKSKVKMNYISSVNDNLFTIIDYLLHKMYFLRKTKDESLKFITYDLFTNKYHLHDLADINTMYGKTLTTLSFFKTNNEMLIQQEPTRLGSFDCPIPKTEAYQNLFSKEMYSFDYAKCQFIESEIEEAQNVNFVNSSDITNDYQPMYKKMFDFPGMEFKQYGAYWNTDLDVYNSSIDALQQVDSLALNITGAIKRQPGSILCISVDRSLKNLQNDSKSELEKQKKMYKAFEGIWYISKVTNIISPTQSSYRQQVALFRNFNSKIVKQSSAIIRG